MAIVSRRETCPSTLTRRQTRKPRPSGNSTSSGAASASMTRPGRLAARAPLDVQTEYQAEHRSRADAGAILRAVEKIGRLLLLACAVRQPQNAGCAATQKQQIAAQVGADRKRIAQVHVETGRATQVQTVHARAHGTHGLRLETAERGVACAESKIGLEAPE